MTNKEFKEAMSVLGNGDGPEEIDKKRKKRNALRAVTVCSAAAVICIGVAIAITAVVTRKADDGKTKKELLNRPTAAPTDEPASEDREYESLKKGVGVRFLSTGSVANTGTKEPVSEDFRHNYTEFALELAGRTNEGSGTLVSPLSVITAMLMTANGASGETYSEMMSVLAGGMTADKANRELLVFTESLKNTGYAMLESSNAVFVSDRDDFKINKRFVHEISSSFKGEIACADFINDLQRSVKEINSWCNEKTKGMIPDILDPSTLDPDTVMVLINAVCFDALWDTPFPFTYDGVFHGTKGDTKVTMMRSAQEPFYIESKNATGFMKPYCGQYGFAALLPKEGVGTQELLSSLDAKAWFDLMENDRGTANANMPKFSFDWEGSLNDVLSGMGIKKAFSAYEADFSGLGRLDDGRGLFINKVVHKTHIDVDEAGTRASAATAVEMVPNSVYDPEIPKNVTLDRPFVYAIIDCETKLPVFIGTVNDITAG